VERCDCSLLVWVIVGVVLDIIFISVIIFISNYCVVAIVYNTISWCYALPLWSITMNIFNCGPHPRYVSTDVKKGDEKGPEVGIKEGKMVDMWGLGNGKRRGGGSEGCSAIAWLGDLTAPGYSLRCFSHPIQLLVGHWNRDSVVVVVVVVVSWQFSRRWWPTAAATPTV